MNIAKYWNCAKAIAKTDACTNASLQNFAQNDFGA